MSRSLGAWRLVPEDAVDAKVYTLIECQQNQCPGRVEVGVLEQRDEPVL